jgi:integrase
VGHLQFPRIIKAAGVPKIRFHDMRHTHATLLLAAGENVKAVSERLGHANITITLQVYAHVLPTMQKSAADTTQRLLG